MSTDLQDLRTLVIDDVSAPRRILKRLLNSLGVSSVDDAANGTEAVEKIESTQYQLIISDFHLGDMTGLEILIKARSNSAYENVPFVMVTSDVDKDDLIRSKKAGVSGFLLKPFTLDSLSDILYEAFESHGIDAPDFEQSS